MGDNKAISQLCNDVKITNGDIPLVNKLQTGEEVFSILEKTKEGEYISIANRNDLSETLVYRRNEIPNNPKKWTSCIADSSWYNELYEEFHLHTPEELLGIGDLVSKGITFENKYIYIENDIDISEYPWKPIGYEESTDILKVQQGEFRGVLDGLNHVICGLHNDRKYPHFMFAFMIKANNAEIKNISFINTDIESETFDMVSSAVCVEAVSSSFSNIMISGKIVGSKVASVCNYAMNTVFYYCKNIARIISHSYNTFRITVGGICSEIEISNSITKDMNVKSAKIFSHCSSNESIKIYGEKISSLYAGMIFGNYLSEDPKFSAIIDKCSIRKDSIIEYEGNEGLFESVYYGKYMDENVRAHIEKDSKKDLLSGLIGRVKSNTSMIVVNVSNSVIVRNMITPGSVKTLESKPNMPTFYTISARSIHAEDDVYDMEPYFTFIKSVRY